ncbi:MAG: hypothetical protein OXF25_05180 [Cyanobacteria bacterium MAG CAR3_bin_5]|nr:hypothetical protein [Cyanobacteria bacterium MAG CAR3_bin_5]
MAFLKSFIGSFTALTSLVLLGGFSPALAGKDYTLKIDRFDDTKTAFYDSITKTECRINGPGINFWDGPTIFGCYFIHSTESLAYPLVSMGTSSKGWKLLDYRSRDEANTIITYLDGSVVRRKLSIKVEGNVSDGGYVSEWVALYLRPIKDELENISQIEVQVGLYEYLWKSDPVLTQKALNFEEP